ncbi:ParB/RepB/Spo0J family partition protein [Plantactinospora sp. KLBMP9567]|uniref:ParB/RepB/Spo0J family partition protein n=1 Tax=Plantactinospora sp. KLBMP9567 TaxID=3085900 RepID=UPI0029811139|nr:ParB N-terminal domain-containing protein [Plantactinospora sp. KLBMP9567]MDW5328900.1 ParB N-terminal domain-containing protein [Plantactinospora sp. KLBMP9567]
MADQVGSEGERESDVDAEADPDTGSRFDTDGAVISVRIADLRTIDSPRLRGVNGDHVRVLAEVQEQLPPILVHRATLSIIDGVHRCRAAQLRGRAEITARFFDGSPEDAFRVAVEANVRHGLGLSLAERRAAAARIIRSNPGMSDRRIAAISGLAARTVASIRARTVGAEAHVRVGRDGVVRPLSTADGRQIARRTMMEQPQLSLRQVAKQAGISVATVRDVRARIQAGEALLPARTYRNQSEGVPQRPFGAVEQGADGGTARSRQRRVRAGHSDVLPVLEGLRRDPSLRYTDSGRRLLQWLNSSALVAVRWRDVLKSVPPHCAVLIGKIARQYGNELIDFATELEHRGSEQRTGCDVPDTG